MGTNIVSFQKNCPEIAVDTWHSHQYSCRPNISRSISAPLQDSIWCAHMLQICCVSKPSVISDLDLWEMLNYSAPFFFAVVCSLLCVPSKAVISPSPALALSSMATCSKWRNALSSQFQQRGMEPDCGNCVLQKLCHIPVITSCCDVKWHILYYVKWL